MKRVASHSIVCRICVFAAALWFVATAVAQTEHPIYQFQGGSDGSAPSAGLINDAKGNLYGTTTGFNYSGGTVFELSPPTSGGAWTETILHNFPANSTDGRIPEAGVIFDKEGNLYGTTAYGGTNDTGIVFELSPPSTSGNPWTETVLYNFGTHASDGVIGGGLVFRGTTLYGTTMYGGKEGDGIFFSLTPTAKGTWAYHDLYSFAGQPDGSEPNYSCEPLINDKQGNFYGVTAYGGIDNGGAVFEMSPPSTKSGTWTETIIYSFVSNSSDGQGPVAGLIFDTSGNLYGTTVAGGALGYGAVFELSPPAVSGDAWTESVIYSFTDSADGRGPWSKLVSDKSGNLYGTNLTGTVYELTPPAVAGAAWSETTIHNFPAFLHDGAEPEGGLLVTGGGNFFGTTYAGGSQGNGIVFEIHP